MMNERIRRKGRGTERLFLLLISIGTGLLFYQMYTVLQKDFEEVPRRLKEGTMINLNDDKPAERVKLLLTRGYYYEDPRDIALISQKVAEGRSKGPAVIDNIGELNKRAYSVNAEEAYEKGGESFRKRIDISRTLIGFSQEDSAVSALERTKPLNLSTTTSVGMGDKRLHGVIVNQQEQPVPGVLVRLNIIVPQDSTFDQPLSEEDETTVEYNNGVRKTFILDSAKKQLQRFSAYARTNSAGEFAFEGLPANKPYELLPLAPGMEFGRSQGVAALNEDVAFRFTATAHTLKLFSSKDFNTFKKEKALIVRTPEEVERWFWIIFGVFIASFIILHIFLSIKFPEADQFILPVIMVFTGLSFITLLSLQDPLRDRFLAKNMLTYFGIGVGAIMLMMLFNLRQFTIDSKLYRMFMFDKVRSAANGWPWAIAGIGLLCLTILFGTGPEGSGVKVNLLGFQPSEIVKFFIIIFLAGFFTVNEKFISEYTTWRKRFSFFFFALMSIIVAILLFLILGDLGPAMVCCFTFIILFSFSRGDFLQMTLSVVLYVLALWLFDDILVATAITMGALILYMFVKKKQLSESAIMALVIISGFLLLDQVPYLREVFPGPMQRLVDRKAIWQDAWNNEVFGGDQVANGIWAMSGGGVTGQGAGEGFAKTIPEAHTDMILPSIGEEFGWAGIITIFILFLIYLHRSIIVGRQTGAPFLFYVCAGIGISTFVQFLLIAGGSTGALPLSGVALPFISYGGSSLLCNMIAAGFLLSASHLKGSTAQMRYISRQDRNLVPALVAACAGILLLSVNVSRYLFNNERWVVEPALVADRSGSRMFSYNPRITILMNRLQAGNLLDRNGMLLATSNVSQLAKFKDSIVSLGIPRENLESFTYKRLTRYYPFGDQMFFWTGDANTMVFNGSTNGYFAEYAHAAELRGFPAPATKFQVSAHRYRAERFLPETQTEMTVSKVDYSAISSLLLAGINSKEVEAFKNKNRDVALTMDAALQTKINRSLASDDSVRVKRVSVVVMESNTGDVLASSAYPLPPVNDWERLTLTEPELNLLPGWHSNKDLGFTHASQPGSTAKLITSLAAFNKLGDEAERLTIRVRPGDLIRTRGPEPDEPGNISIERGLVRSNNSFFIRLANEFELQEEMANLYMQAGWFLRAVGGYYYQTQTNNPQQQERWRELWRKTEFRSLKRYNPDNIRRTRAIGISGMAWGQGELIATPAAVARIAAGIANNGTMLHNRYVKSISGVATAIPAGQQIVRNPRFAALMTDYMLKQSASKETRLGLKVAGKTGTPERIIKGQRINDGWYVFFAPKDTGAGHIVVCIRIEGTKGSSDAVKLAGKHVIPFLLQKKYVRSFPSDIAPAGRRDTNGIRLPEPSLIINEEDSVE
jgi:cell division protein FtsW (lipid II flippase)